MWSSEREAVVPAGVGWAGSDGIMAKELLPIVVAAAVWGPQRLQLSRGCSFTVSVLF